MFYNNKIPKSKSFTFGEYEINPKKAIVTFTYYVELENGKVRTYKDSLFFKNIPRDSWSKIPNTVLEPTLQALLLMIGINYWCVFPTNNIKIRNFSLTQDQAIFWDTLYLNGLGEFFYDMKIDFHDLIKFPFDENKKLTNPGNINLPKRTLLLNGAGKDSILSAEILKSNNVQFDFFAFAPTPAHKKIAKLVGAKTIQVTRKRDKSLERTMDFYNVSNAYPSVSTFTFVATLLAELLGYDSIIFSNEKSADFGNLKYLGLDVNHQWCKSTEAEQITNDYIQRYITPDIHTKSLLRQYSELEIVKLFVNHKKYLHYVTSCNTYFWLPRFLQLMQRKAFWCKRCPKCIFLFACFSAFLPKIEVISIFGKDLYNDKWQLSYIKRILGIEGFKPLDCVGEPEEMILAMHYASIGNEYQNDIAINMFNNRFPKEFNFKELEQKVFTNNI